MFDIGLWEMVAIAVIALLLFGDRLPEVVTDLGRLLRQLRQLAAGARRDLTEGLGPEFDELRMSDLNPRNFVRKHLLDPIEDGEGSEFGDQSVVPRQKAAPRPPEEQERPPYDVDAT
ncbi:MAG TPA: sec-independent translocase [Actinomycetes bacterium]|nr:sec-independent translocase [Actinomycetes bacterium]